MIYRFQVLKQADVVLALFLQGDHFSLEQKRADFEYYDPITTGDSTLSGVVQSIIAAEVGYRDLALRYFHSALFVDLADLHGNATDGVHVASTGGVWNALAYGFGGMRDYNGVITFDPRLPETWERLTFQITLQGSRIRVDLIGGGDRLHRGRGNLRRAVGTRPSHPRLGRVPGQGPAVRPRARGHRSDAVEDGRPPAGRHLDHRLRAAAGFGKSPLTADLGYSLVSAPSSASGFFR